MLCHPARVPGLAETPDAVSRVLLSILEGLGRLLRWAGLSEDLLTAVLQLVYLALFTGVVLALVRLRRQPATWRSSALFGVAAAVLGVWIVRHRGGGFESALARGDHLLFAGLGGAALRVLPGPARMHLLVAISAGVTATFLAFQGPLVPEFPTSLLRLIGLR